MKKIFLIFGTRPEAIKMAPLVHALREDAAFDPRVVLTMQHQEMLDQVMHFFRLKADFNLGLMKNNQDLFQVTTRVGLRLKELLSEEQPDLMLVHGDTTTTMTASMAAFYYRIPLGHVEAGLRSGNKYAPYPEEINRKLTTDIADYHFAPTETARQNLLRENIPDKSIVVTGNTGIDALQQTLACIEESLNLIRIRKVLEEQKGKKHILVTAHRRENIGEGFTRVCEALKAIAREYEDVHILFPLHLNPGINDFARKQLKDFHNISLLAPLNYEDFVYALTQSYLILTDSGGVQEEAPNLGKPVLVMRDTTERPEAVKEGVARLVGTDKDRIIAEIQKLLTDEIHYKNMSRVTPVYGDGRAVKRIVKFIKREL